MAKQMTAGLTRKSHKSRKTTPSEPVQPESSKAADGGPSSTALTIATPASPPPPSDASVGIVATPVPREDPAKQWWKRPADSKAKKIAEKIVVMQTAGRTTAEIAKKLGSTEGSIRQYLYIARKNGWLDADDEPVDLEVELALSVDRKVVRNIGAALDGGMTNYQTHEMTIAAAKGRGIFKNHEVNKNDGPSALAVVAIQVVMPPLGASDQLPAVSEEQMGGVPAYIDGQVVEGTAAPRTDS